MSITSCLRQRNVQSMGLEDIVENDDIIHRSLD
uniref:Uncharacterized protein n=1 Tax=Rhizophora mucronata TaxID=61149 RepID=A0A2P2QRI2_RHIMU